jgi:hypothetical protein
MFVIEFWLVKSIRIQPYLLGLVMGNFSANEFWFLLVGESRHVHR